MRLVTFKAGADSAKIGVVVGQEVLPLPSADRDMTAFLAAGPSAMAEAERINRGEKPPAARYPLSEIKLLAPVLRPGKIIAVGLNYRDHAIETKQEIPTSPIIFAKFPTSVTHPDTPVVLPDGDPQADYEAELAVVIGRQAKGVAEANAMDYVAGYMPLNDVSARKWQFSDKQWVRGKSCDTFCPMGPWLTTKDSVSDPHALFIRTRVNSAVMQNSNTSNLIFKVPFLIQFLSASMTLEPGDVIATGTPDGVGVFRKPPVFLKSGDVMEVEIEGLGVLRNPVT
ncbi:MAG TPA: fumarylacetoacetate hydrolase family protein [Candidatus Sulfotelmatobacter sp.]|nr:fumarylacetoacetate hydrolase family protein [Candidatus Sulfotelmatobacter sp.]